MAPVQSLLAGWRRWKAVAARELLRDPTVVLFERAPETVSAREGARGG